MSGDFEDGLRVAEYAMLRAALVSTFLRVAGEDAEVYSVNALVRRSDNGQFEIEVEFGDAAGFPCGGLSV